MTIHLRKTHTIAGIELVMAFQNLGIQVPGQIHHLTVLGGTDRDMTTSTLRLHTVNPHPGIFLPTTIEGRLIMIIGLLMTAAAAPRKIMHLQE